MIKLLSDDHITLHDDLTEHEMEALLLNRVQAIVTRFSISWFGKKSSHLMITDKWNFLDTKRLNVLCIMKWNVFERKYITDNSSRKSFSSR